MSTRSGRARPNALLLSLLFWAALPISTAAANLLFVDLRSDYEPGVEFQSVRAELRDLGTGALRLYWFVLDASSEPDVGIRVADFNDLEDGTYYLDVYLLDGLSDVVASQGVELRLGGNYAVTMVASRPAVTANKTWQLARDVDGDGRIGRGDELRYTVLVGPTGALDGVETDGVLTFTDRPGLGSRLVPGSVTTTRGVVFKGNLPGDDSVEVRLGAMAGGELATVTFDAVVEPAVSNQGVVEFRSQFARGVRSRTKVTDDPSLAGPRDPTVTPLTALGCQQGGCEQALEQCQDALAACQQSNGCGELEVALAICDRERQEAEVTLGQLTSDEDEDGVIAARDDCPGSEPGAAVDAVGCSRAQFCRQVPADGRGWRGLCRSLDWRNDEPESPRPRDCAPTPNGCGPR